MRLLLIHGVGHKEANGTWDKDWQEAIRNGFVQIDPMTKLDFAKFAYDSIFQDADLDAAVVAEATARLLASGIWHGVGDFFKARGLADTVRWTAGMVAQWAADEELRANCRKALVNQIKAVQPDIICAHSLGSLIAYDTLARDPKLIKGKAFLSFGSQIGNPCVRSTFGGRIEALPDIQWFHLFNDEDAVLTAELRIHAPTFTQIDTFFDIDGIADHDADQYLSHPNTVGQVWAAIAKKTSKSYARHLTSRPTKKAPKKRALLVGINQYPDPTACLDGCVNDVYLMSEALQEAGFRPEEMRMLLNERAKASAIRERLEWLLDDVSPQEQCLFFYSGHGAQIPGYGALGEVDSVDECLVPHDFDWTGERAVLDDWFCELYSQLPYDANFVAILDCCHSGGMTRNGAQKVRGISPPDDIRHRALRWDKQKQMWVSRDLEMAQRSLVTDEADKTDYLGVSGAVKRLGRAVSLWGEASKAEQTRKTFNHLGPYLPILLEACREEEFSYEYRHGATTYGAFTYNLVQHWRKLSGRATWSSLMSGTARQIKALKYDQHPVLVCPESKRNGIVPS